MANLATATELAALLQRDLDTSSATQAVAQASAIVRRHCKQNIDSQTYTSVKLPIEPLDHTWAVALPQRPVTAVSAVSVNGTPYVADTDYAWNGFAPYIRLAKRTWTTAAFQDEPVATVTYTAGFAVVPEDVKAVVLAVAARIYDNPTGLRSYSIDDHSEGYAGADDDLAGVALLRSEKSLLRDYRLRAGSVRV